MAPEKSRDQLRKRCVCGYFFQWFVFGRQWWFCGEFAMFVAPLRLRGGEPFVSHVPKITHRPTDQLTPQCPEKKVSHRWGSCRSQSTIFHSLKSSSSCAAGVQTKDLVVKTEKIIARLRWTSEDNSSCHETKLQFSSKIFHHWVWLSVVGWSWWWFQQ